MTRHLLAVDLGASSGRVMCCTLTGEGSAGTLRLDEAHRFANRTVFVPDDGPRGGRFTWDIVGLYADVLHGLREGGRRFGGAVDAIGIDSWGVDYGLLDAQGRLIANPTAYRDPRHPPVAERVNEAIGWPALYERTGIQKLPFNTLYQLAADAEDPSEPLERAASALMIPQLLGYWLAGEKRSEHTLASTGGCYDTESAAWCGELLTPRGVPENLLPPAVQPTDRIGTLRPGVAEDLGLPAGTPLIAVGSHDTASAVAGAPLSGPGSAYLSSGTWSLLGVELDEPIRTAAARDAGFTNEGGVSGTIRFLKNHAGLWLVQECRRAWNEGGNDYGFPELAHLAEAAGPSRCSIDADDPRFAVPGDMPARVREAAAERGAPLPDEPGAVMRCVLESLAAAYAGSVRTLGELTGRPVDRLHLVGGGGNHRLLNRLTADACGVPVEVGPTEATVVGNALVQAMALGRVADLAEARAIVRASFPIETVEPSPGRATD
ncbi:rhamnulokinase [Phycisphaera mikurensis]|uniref:Rhamnulokinase n=1 Tax=Phycisphaera mikurensis (strain NBRC 102666 / KCTC 22515 / FYK2301M01) TaxID=1142394 RepID=I0IEJ0_PHYMF|nr:rhamnulokinase family protein [Phycisphaera mikurensis]MBB6441477.1 rhamnulokinase [Phycisphaera mikurensis]BAM03678.1 rhamnulokinase [Phycisphaera mikurensis NBRC 102666]